jgi:hypothetical protein
MGEAQALAIEVRPRPEAEQDQAARGDPAGGVERQDLVDTPAVLAAVEGLPDQAAQGLVEVGGETGQGLARHHRDRHRVDLQLGCRSLRQ